MNNLEELKALPLLVVLDGSEKFNQNFRTAVEYELDYFENYKFVTPSEFETLSKDKNNEKKYGVLQYHSVERIAVAPANSISFSFLGELPSICNASIYKTDDEITNGVTTDGDLHWLIQKFQFDISFANEYLNMDKKARKELVGEYEARASNIKNLTLLIDENSMDDKLKEKIADVYPYKYKIVQKDSIDLAIINAEEDVVYFRVAPYVSAPSFHTERNLTSSDQNSRTYTATTGTRSVTDYKIKMFFGAKEKKPLVSLRPPGFKVGDSENSNKLSVKDIEELLKMIK